MLSRVRRADHGGLLGVLAAVRPIRPRVALAGVCAALVVSVAVLGVPTAAYAASGVVAGTVFEDYNADGAQENGPVFAPVAKDIGVKNASVTITDSTGATVGTATTDAAGAFSVTCRRRHGAVRVEVTPPPGFTAGPHGPSSGTTVQFVTLGTAAATTVKVGVVRHGDYAQNGPPLLNAEQWGAYAGIPPNSTPVPLSMRASLVTNPYSDRGTESGVAPPADATADQTGAVWGVAALGTRFAFTSALFKRHSMTGPGGLGAVYLTDLGPTGTPAAPNAAPWVTIPNAGTNPRGDETAMMANDWFHDIAAYPEVGKIALGGMAMAPDNQSIYVINLNSKSMWQVPFTLGGGGAPVAGAPVEIPLPLALPGAAAGCTTDNLRPFGVSVTIPNHSLWVTLTCVGPGVGDLHGYVYRYDTTTAAFDGAPAFETTLSGYPRGSAYTACSVCSATWHAWNDTPYADGTAVLQAPYNPAVDPQPLLSDIAFDANGDMTIGIKDRFGDQGAFPGGSTTPNDNTGYSTFAAGGMLRACRDLADTAWVLESNGVCGTRTGVRTGDGHGPGGGEFYQADNLGDHDQSSLGALLQVPGYGEVLGTAYDPAILFSDGVRFFSNDNGQNDSDHTLQNQTITGTFGKGGGLGDMTALITAAPIEIGNRVWLDANQNGVQDAGEANVPGVQVGLYAADGTTLLATAVTDAAGTYYFSNATGTSTGNAIYGITGLQPGMSYVVRLDRAADYQAGGPLAGLSPTSAGAGPDRAVDSNGTLVGGLVEAPVSTDPAGVNDHTIDFGFTNVIDTTPPSCVLTAVINGPPKQLQITANDSGTGLASIVPTTAINATVNVPAFTPGTTGLILVTATKTNQAQSAQVALRVTDVAGNFTDCDPVLATVTARGTTRIQKLTGLPQAEHVISLTNGKPGLTSLKIAVNGHHYTLARLKNNQRRHLDIAQAMRPGTHNTITLTGTGKRGATGDILITDH